MCVGSCDQRRAGDSSGAAEELRARGQRLKDMNIYSHEYAVYAYKMRTDEVYPAAFGSFIFINIGLHASKRGTRSCATVSWMWRSASDMDISPPVATRAVGAQVARGRRHGREAGMGTWVFEQRVCASAATNGVRETVVARRRS